jgi:oligoribonuclease NrnB/cAMP/cGMP phosphodiesterase (DHH superfamily)
MKTAIVYHQIKKDVDCPDGIAAAWVAKQKYPDAVLIGANYGQEPPDITFFDRVLVVDFSFPIDILNQWDETTELTVIDHHKTAMKDLENFSNAIFDMDESGATLAWRVLFPNDPVPTWLDYVRDRDLWNFELPASEEIHEAVAFMGRSMRQMDWLTTLGGNDLVDTLKPIGAKLLEPKRKRIAEIAATAIETQIYQQYAMFVEIPESETRLTSDVCAAIYKANPTRAFVMARSWNSAEGRWDLSFRSDKNGKDFDVSQVAKSLGGGGHRNASGAKTDAIEFAVTWDWDLHSAYRQTELATKNLQDAIECQKGMHFNVVSLIELRFKSNA